jgi:hypothetical protein
MSKRLSGLAIFWAGLILVLSSLYLGARLGAAWTAACLLCAWFDIPPWVRTAIAVVTSLDAVGGVIGAAVGERIGGAFGRGFGRKLGERVGSGELLGLATGGTGVITGAQSLGGWAHDQVTGKIKGGLQDKGLEFLLGDDKASRRQEATDWFNSQAQKMISD